MFVFNAVVRCKSLNTVAEFGLKIYKKHRSIVWCEVYFDILNRSGRDHECDRETNRRTDSLTANAALNYVDLS